MWFSIKRTPPCQPPLCHSGLPRSGKSGIHNHRSANMDSGLLAEPVIGPATSGRTRWLGPGMTRNDSSVLKLRRYNRVIMDTSLIAAVLGAQTGMVQLAVAARLARMDADQGASVAKLVDAAQQTMDSLANVTAGIGTNLDVSA